MIRPLEYCENENHIRASIDTIDLRILELIILRKKYLSEAQKYAKAPTNGQTSENAQKMQKEKCTLAKEVDIDRIRLEAFLEEITNSQTNEIKKHG